MAIRSVTKPAPEDGENVIPRVFRMPDTVEDLTDFDDCEGFAAELAAAIQSGALLGTTELPELNYDQRWCLRNPEKVWAKNQRAKERKLQRDTA